MNNYIKINHLTSIDLYNNLNLIVHLNKFITITGPNNSGKSTLLKLLNKDIDIENTIFINNKDISKYTYKEYYKLTKLISVDNLLFNKSNILDEIKFYLLRNNNYTKDNLDYYLKQFKLNSKKLISNLTIKEKIYLKIIEALIDESNIILIDSIDRYLDVNTINRLINKLIKNNKTIIMTISNLELSIKSDYLYVIGNNKSIILEGIPKTVLEKDNILNKNGIELPFIIDLSVKLKDYNLVDKLYYDEESLINDLWN